MVKDFKDFNQMNYYEILDIDTSATALEIHNAFETVLRAYQEDALGVYTLFNSEELDRIRGKIQEAYQTLNRAESRKAYDRALGLPVQEEPEPEPEPVRDTAFGETAEEKAPPSAEMEKEKIEERGEEDHKDEEDITFYNGLNLRRLRKRKKITIETISGITKISPLFLRKIEKDEFQGLPERVFVRGFVKEFAKCLQIDHEKAIDDFIMGYDEWLEKKQKKQRF